MRACVVISMDKNGAKVRKGKSFSLQFAASGGMTLKSSVLVSSNVVHTHTCKQQIEDG